MIVDIEKQLALLDQSIDSGKLSESQKMHCERRKRFLKMVLNAPTYEITEKSLNFIYRG